MKPIQLVSLVAGALLAGACSTVNEAGPRAGQVTPVQWVRHGASNTEALYATGRYYQGQVRYEQAIDYYRRLLEEVPNHAEGHNALGVIYAMQGRNAAAESEFVAALATAPEAAHIHNNLGYLLLRQGRLSEAVASLDRAVSLDPANLRAHDNLLEATRRLAAAGSGDAPQAEVRPVPAPAVASQSLPAPMTVAPAPASTLTPVATTTRPVGEVVGSAATGGMEMTRVSANVYELRQPAAVPSVPTTTPPVAVAPPIPSVTAARVTSPALPAELALAPAAQSVRLEVANGNGVEGLARRTSRYLQTVGYPAARLTNQKPFAQVTTEIQYRPGYEAQANNLQRALAGKGTLAEAKGLRPDVQVRVVLGQNLRTTAQLAALEAGPLRVANNGDVPPLE